MTEKDKTVSRRNFLLTTGVLGVGSLAGVNAIASESPTSDKAVQKDIKVPSRPFGRTGRQVSILSLGGIFDISTNQLVLKQALKHGVTYWDTAEIYVGGKSEKGIGMFFQKNPEVRSQIFLVTKSRARDPEGMSRTLQQSFERMNTNYIDLFFVHGIDSISELNDKTRTWAEKAKKEGKIRHFGFSTHKNMEECLLAGSKLSWIDGIMMTYNYRIMDEPKMVEAVNACHEAGIGLTAMKTQASGQLRALINNSDFLGKLADRLFNEGYSEHQAKLKIVWENPKIASICSQMATIAILQANVAAAADQKKLSSNVREMLNSYAWTTRNTYCAGCSGICEAGLAENLPVSDVMRFLMYYHEYGEPERAREEFRSLPERTRALLATTDFRRAERLCPRGLRIGELVDLAARIL